MTKIKKPMLFYFIITALGAVILFAPVLAHAQEPTVQNDSFFRAKVLEVLKEFETDDQGIPVYRQEILVRFKLDGAPVSKIIVYDLDLDQKHRLVRKGQYVVVGLSYIGEEETYYVSDVYRLRSLWWLLAGFALLTIALARSYGARAIIGLIVSFLIIIYAIVPLLLKGANPFFVALIGTISMACFVFYLAHGINARTTIAFISTIFTLIFSAVMAILVVNFTRLTGLGTEEAFFLQFAPGGNIDLRGLLLAGILIGALGVLDDVTTAQSAAVEQIHEANHKLGFKQLYSRGFKVGREHITSLVNTLILAYTGVSLPLILLFQIYERPLWATLNSEVVLKEVIRMLVGSIALVAAVPLTTLIAAWFYSKKSESGTPKH